MTFRFRFVVGTTLSSLAVVSNEEPGHAMGLTSGENRNPADGQRSVVNEIENLSN